MDQIFRDSTNEHYYNILHILSHTSANSGPIGAQEFDVHEYDNRTNSAGLRDSGLRIIFSPNTDLAWSIIREINSSFGIIDKSRDAILNIQSKNEHIRQLLYNLSIDDPNQTLVNNIR